MQSAFGDRIAVTLVASSGGCFEVDVAGKRIYSKLETGAFPHDEDIEAEVQRQLA